MKLLIDVQLELRCPDEELQKEMLSRRRDGGGGGFGAAGSGVGGGDAYESSRSSSSSIGQEEEEVAILKEWLWAQRKDEILAAMKIISRRPSFCGNDDCTGDDIINEPTTGIKEQELTATATSINKEEETAAASIKRNKSDHPAAAEAVAVVPIHDSTTATTTSGTESSSSLDTRRLSLLDTIAKVQRQYLQAEKVRF